MKKQPKKKRLVLGITGTFGSGKTSVSRLFKSFGAKVIDADKIARQILKPGERIYKKLIKAFGKTIAKKGQDIDRIKLAKVVFKDKKLLERLNKIMHPEIIRIIKNQIKASSDKPVVLDAPLLIEAGLRRSVDKLIVVKTKRKELLKRMLKNRSLNRIDTLKRINSQISLEDKVRLADFVIDNSGSIEQTKKQVKQIRRQLWKN